MKGLIVFTAMVLGFATLNMVQVGASASTYRAGIESYVKAQSGHSHSPLRSPAIVKNN